MRPLRPRAAFSDERGGVTDLVEGVRLDAVSLLTSRRGAVRGNHLHKRTFHYLYVLEGTVRYLSRRGRGKVRTCVLGPGQMVLSPAGEAHAMISLEDSKVLVLSRG